MCKPPYLHAALTNAPSLPQPPGACTKLLTDLECYKYKGEPYGKSFEKVSAGGVHTCGFHGPAFDMPLRTDVLFLVLLHLLATPPS